MPQASVSLLIINYRTALLARQAIASARASTSTPLQVVVVDNSVGGEEVERLRDVSADVLLQPDRNLGFAAGINHGLPRCEGEMVIIANPDVVFRSGAIDRLSSHLAGNVAMAGPRFSWDEGDRWMMPPATESTRREKLSQAVATRWPSWRRKRDRARARRRLDFWSLSSPDEIDLVSGAVMAIRKSVLVQLGGFDERFRLYFEEIDLMRRLRRAGWRIVYDPRAVCRHLYNQSAWQEPASRSLFEESERAYYAKWFGNSFPRLVSIIADNQKPATGNRQLEFQRLSPDDPIPVTADPKDHLIEASPLQNFDSATGHFPTENSVRFPPDVWAAYRDETLYLRVLHRKTLTVRAQYRVEKTV